MISILMRLSDMCRVILVFCLDPRLDSHAITADTTRGEEGREKNITVLTLNPSISFPVIVLLYLRCRSLP